MYRSAFWLNLVAFLLVLALVGYAKMAGPSASALFEKPNFSPYPAESLLTHTFQLLCSVPVIACAFGFGLLRVFQPGKPENRFILASAWLTGGFLINEIFRIHIHLVHSGIPKLATVCVYALVAVWYGFTFRWDIRKTPYFLLLIGAGCLFTGILVDSLNLGDSGLPVFLEGMPKLFSEINIAIYFWLVCHAAVLRSQPNWFKS